MNYAIRNILVPIDLSETSLNALETAACLSKKHNARLHILYVAEPVAELPLEGDNKSNLKNVPDILSALAGAVEHAHDIDPSLIHEEGHVLETILRISGRQNCDLIVMGSNGASGFRDGFAGSNTYNVIKHSRCPVLSIPARKKYTSFRNILYPVRPVTGALSGYQVASHFMNEQSLLNVLGLSYRLSERNTSILDKIVDEIRPQLASDLVQPRVNWGEGRPVAMEVLQYAQMNLPDLIIVTSGLDVTIKPNYIGPHAQRIIHEARTPVLCIKKVGVPSLV